MTTSHVFCPTEPHKHQEHLSISNLEIYNLNPNLPSSHGRVHELSDFVEFGDKGFELSKHRQIFLNHF